MPLSRAILLDSNAGAPLHPRVRQALFAFLDTPLSTGNPQSLHSFGRSAAKLVAEAETAVLRTFKALPADWRVSFTSSGTEANRLAIQAGLGEATAHSRVWGVSEVEHSSVLDLRTNMTRAGAEIRMLKPNSQGEVVGFTEALSEAGLISVIGVGNETGICQHLLTSHILSGQTSLKKNRPRYHADFIAGWGKAELDLSHPAAPDLITIAGHKLGGVSGVGAVIHRKSIPIERAGTPNLLGIIGMKTLAENWELITTEQRALGALRDQFEMELQARLPSVVVTGQGTARVSGVTHIRFSGFEKDLALVPKLDLRGFAVSSGSACASMAPEPSHVLRAMGISDTEARNSLRVSLHPGNSAAELRDLVDALVSMVPSK